MEGEKKRLFIAIDIPDFICNELKVKVYKKRDFGRVSWVSPGNFHITLKFLGDVREEDIGKVADILTKTALGKGEATLAYAGVGVFPAISKPKIVWVGWREAGRTLRELAENLEERFYSELGIAKERKTFVPHLTIARIKGEANKRALSDFLKDGASLCESSFKVSEIVLYCSELKPTGAVYTKIKSVSLL